MRKRMTLGIAIAFFCALLLCSCGGSAPKIPSWLQGTWVCEETGEKAVFTKDNFSIYSAYNYETLNLANMIVEVEDEGGEVKVKNSNSKNNYILSLINAETKEQGDFVFTKESDNEFSFLGLIFTK